MASNQVTLISGVLAVIERVQSPHGTLVIVMNYTGNCLNFGLTVERTKSIGIHVDIIVLSNWPVPGNLASNQLKPDELGLGMGIHNESGFLKTKMMGAKEMVQAAAHHALQALMTYTKARVGDRTLMDMLCPFIIALNNRSLEKVVELVQLSASSTRTMSSHLGRSSYLSNQNLPDSNVPDAGAYGLALLLNEMV
ncbi:hypothetical protein CU098_007540 [Rhizopus stolonifer]|uniref:DhaK domain-containing protein n=1 Tax=Rhizopus stolonifer TaxID=4846 RepID=A0A367JEK4_RHIST|nr:hypothetical protein CU098_007540 [Rhizopus stolonifer]